MCLLERSVQDGDVSSGQARAVDRTLTEREAEVASFLASALSDGGDALRSQVKAGARSV